MRILTLGLALAASLALAGCANQQYDNTRQIGGGLLGAGAGGLAGAALAKNSSSSTRAAATGLGAVLGLVVGSEIGRYMDEQDRQQSYSAWNQATRAPVGQTVSWNNPRSGNYGSVVPVRDGYHQSGAYCREFQQTIVVGGRTERGFGTACQQPDGSWKTI
ncbi:RT0821/Lpp0805 family surface protein [Aquibaculum arenosum]|uniref:RT0821/Lpp0805 family surface protein n=1 Tax=Aquibaculum arenosum TaxID=3032591 RepID=A0ABT5YLX7_9PROT|nr:RT0821/Lpp0805 family surface protein [Fodinicurvata sp. CAU 1616]MDF2095968.1 RT0821/Lpp0805 family surface protein [Fodinicurvata sp. CAU 1616]